MTLLVTSIAADDVGTMLARADEAFRRGADAVELRLDALKDSIAGVSGIARDLPTGRWIATCRPVSQGGRFQGPVERRVELLLAAGEPGQGFVDFEYADWAGDRGSALARHDLTARRTGSGPDAQTPSIILSHHDFERRPADLEQLVAEMAAEDAAAALKIVWPAEDVLSNFEAFELLRSSPREMIAFCLGEHGLPSRVLAKKFGAFASYCALDEGEETAPGQLSLAQMKETFQWDRIDEATEVYGVIGHPVGHSLSPAIFNAAFAESGAPGVYLPFPVEPTYEAFATFLDQCLACDWLDARGFSVTLPHKEHAHRYLGDRVDPPADVIGAVNTLRIEEGEIWGCNTDGDGALEALVRGMEIPSEELDGLTVDLLGAGGAARAVVCGLIECGAHVTVYNRDRSRADRLAADLGCTAKDWDDRVRGDAQVLINCTSVGMWPDADGSPMPADALRPDCVVFDTVYRPAETRLLHDAKAAGCRTIPGAAMFVAQAAFQFEYWTQQAADWTAMARLTAWLLGGGDTR